MVQPIHQQDANAPPAAGAAIRAVPEANTENTLWLTFAGSESAIEMLRAWLALQCAEIPSARAAALLLLKDDAFTPAAVWPDRLTDVTYLGAAAERALTERVGVAQPAAGASQKPGDPRLHVAYPIEGRGEIHGVVVVDVAAKAGADLQFILRRLHWGVGWIEGFVWQSRTDQIKTRLDAAATAIAMLAVAEEHETIDGAAIAVANELAQKLRCERVAIGMAVSRGIRVRALSHAAWFQQKADIVAAIENAMEEAFDQLGSIAVPPVAATEYRIGIAHAELMKRWGAKSIASVVMRARSEAAGVMTLERTSGEPFDAETLELLELVASIVGPVLKMKADARRWIGGRTGDLVRSALRALFGKRYPAVKVLTVAAAAAIAFLAVTTGEFRVTARSVLEGSVQRAAVAPFPGYIQTAAAKAGDVVREGQPLATLDDRDLRLDVMKLESEREKITQRQRDAHAKHDRAGMLVASAQLRQAEAELALANEKLARTRIVAPISGLVVAGDLSQVIGSPVEQGKVLFEVAPLSSYRVVIQVSEYDIRYIKAGQRGVLSLTGTAGATLPIEVERITAISSPQGGRNVFRVEALLQGSDAALRPGMEGVAKIVTGEASLLWIWTRSLFERLEVLVWEWTP